MIGRLIGGRYKLLEVVGRGGHSVVYRAADMRALVEVAVKVLHDTHRRDAEFVTRLEREYEAMRTLRRTAAPRAYALSREGDDVFVVMELLRGRDLHEHLAAIEDAGGRMPLEDVVHCLEPVVATLEVAHDKGILHRDVKPGNIFVMEDADPVGVRLLDFGLAAVGSARRITRDGMVFGSPSYIAPEVWEGKPQALDHRVDVYSLGAVIFRALSGRVPFQAETIKEKIALATRGERPSLKALRPELPPQIDEWTRQALAANPGERFYRVRGMWSALLDVLELHSAAGVLRSADAR